MNGSSEADAGWNLRSSPAPPQVTALELFRIAPKGTKKVSEFLVRGADALVEGGKCAGPPDPRTPGRALRARERRRVSTLRAAAGKEKVT